MSGAELVAAVGRGDAEGVRRLLEGGAAPDTVAEDGLPVLCRAIDAYEADVAEALVEAGADQDRELPDGTTPLMRAVDGGSPAMVTAVLGADPAARLSSERRDELLDRARRLYADGAEVVLGGRLGSAEAVERVTVMDDEYHRVAELRLGGAVVRAGHGAIVTDLEWAFRILPPVAELAARAVATGDPDHVDWSAAAWALYQRRSREAWSEVAALHTSPVALERRFALDVLGMHVVVPWASWRNTYEKETVDLLLSWAVRGEEDSGVLGELLYVLSLTGRPDTSEAGLRHARHQDPRYGSRRRVIWSSGSTTPSHCPARRPAPCCWSSPVTRTGTCASRRQGPWARCVRATPRPPPPCSRCWRTPSPRCGPGCWTRSGRRTSGVPTWTTLCSP
ncbi:hypothetical protein ASR50_05210 [Streptomyces sp. 4F]|nr:hypothetical protein ASR50_05210 [Streptomyces sp. 4F]